MHIDLDAFFVSVEQAINPELKGKPVVVGGRPDRRGVVSAASYEARAFGLHSAMPLITASRLCPQAIFIEGNFSRYRDYSKIFMAILADYSPYLEPGGLDEAYLNVTGFESLHGSILNMAQSIKQKINKELDICASIGIAGNKIVAKVASDLSKPDGLIDVANGEEAAFLAPLTIDKLPGIGKKSQRTLHNMGIRTLGELAAIPQRTLKSHFGIYGETLHNHANGIDNREIEPPRTARSISHETTFAEDIRDQKLLQATLRYLSEKVGARLRHQGKFARCVTLKLRFHDFTTITRSQTLSQGIEADQVIFQTGLKLLKKAVSTIQAVRLIGIGISGLTEQGIQLGMLDSSALRQEQLDKAIDHIRNKYGFTAIQTGRTLQLKDIWQDNKQDHKMDTLNTNDKPYPDI